MNIREIILQEMVNLLKEDYTKVTGDGSPDNPFNEEGARWSQKIKDVHELIRTKNLTKDGRKLFFVKVIVNQIPRIIAIEFPDSPNADNMKEVAYYTPEEAKRAWDYETKTIEYARISRENRKKDQEEAIKKHEANFQSNFSAASSLLQRKAFKINSSDPAFVSIQDIANKYQDSICFFNLWAKYCGACESEMPAIKSYIDGYNKKNPNKKILYIGLFLVDEDQEDQMRYTSSETPKDSPGNSILYFSRYDILFKKVKKQYKENITIPRSLLFVDGKFTNVFVGNLAYYGVDRFINIKPSAATQPTPAAPAQQAQPAAPTAPAAKPASPPAKPAAPAPAKPAFKTGQRVLYKPTNRYFVVDHIDGNTVYIKDTRTGAIYDVPASDLK